MKPTGMNGQPPAEQGDRSMCPPCKAILAERQSGNPS